ncbi:hypothetical protein AC626_18960 [Pseudoalteromonas rubra]|uniref:Uncharacterized protein n=1 Tax=Pseudoalteromonas rubra TaxID=43658 RepID=A0A0L0EQF5_9GAMM|nr:hypothetical protein AC626_18960 [Pseudoalteromonas rubra]
MFLDQCLGLLSIHDRVKLRESKYQLFIMIYLWILLTPSQFGLRKLGQEQIFLKETWESELAWSQVLRVGA